SHARTTLAEAPVRHSAGTMSAKAPPSLRHANDLSTMGSHRLDTPARGTPRAAIAASASTRIDLSMNWYRTNGGFPTTTSNVGRSATWLLRNDVASTRTS